MDKLIGKTGFPSSTHGSMRLLFISIGLLSLLAGCALPPAALPAAIFQEAALATAVPTESLETPAAQGERTAKAETALAAATQEPAPPEEMAGKLVLWHSLEGDDLALLEQALAPFQKSFPGVQFQSEYIPFDDLLQRYTSAAVQGKGPTILLGSSTWGPELYDAGLIQDVGKIAPAAFWDRIQPAALQTVLYREAWIGLPWSFRQGVVLMRNRVLIPKMAFSLDELLEMAQSYTRGDVVGAIFDLGFYYSGAHISGCNGRWMDAQGKPLFDNQTGYCWVDLLAGIQEAGVPLVFNSEQDRVRFGEGRTGMIIDGSWNIRTLAESIGSDNLAIDPWPFTEKGRLSGFLETENLFLSADLQPDDIAANTAFLRFMLNDSTQGILTEGSPGSRLPVIKGMQFENRLQHELAAAFAGDMPVPGRLLMERYSATLDQALRYIFLADVPKEEALRRARNRIEILIKEMADGD